MKIKKKDYGFTLVELMISMVIGLVVIAAIIAVFISSSRTSSATSTLSRAQESARFAVQYIGRELRHAGYASAYENDIFAQDVVFPASGDFSLVGQIVAGTDNSSASGVLPGTDVIQVRYTGSALSPITDCRGDTIPAESLITVRIYVNDDAELVCTVDGGGEEVLVQDINGLQLTYGVDTDNDGSVNSYVAASAVTHWLDVLSVRAQISVDSERDEVEDRTVTTVIALRNSLS